MTRQELIDRLREFPLNLFHENPYSRSRGLQPQSVRSAWLGIREESVLAADLKIMFLLDFSREVESISANMRQGIPFGDNVIAENAEKEWMDTYENQQ